MAEPGKIAGEKPASRRLVLRTLVVLAAGFVVIPVSCLLKEVFTPSPDPLPPAECVSGTFRQVEGVGVLTLRGTPYERGFAHGWLTARGVLDMVDAVCGTNLLLSDTDDYEEKILPLMERFVFTPDDEAELRGILDGVRKKLGDGATLRKIGRPLTLSDLKALNTAGDWYRQACSTFAAWGSVAEGEHVWVGRNFDFMPTKAFFPHQMFVVHERSEKTRAWATVAAPGMIGCITGINEDGVFASTHDVFLPLRPVEDGYVPRLIVLRRLMETCEARDLVGQALPVLQGSLQMFDSSLFMAAPVNDGTTPAVVFEYDGERSKDRGVTVRTPEDNEEELSREMITCTNHYRKRVKPGANLTHYRYPLMRRVLMAKTGRGLKVDFDIARKTMGAVRLPITAHTAILDLDTLELWYAPGAFLSPPGNRDYVKLPLREWLTGAPSGGE